MADGQNNTDAPDALSVAALAAKHPMAAAVLAGIAALFIFMILVAGALSAAIEASSSGSGSGGRALAEWAIGEYDEGPHTGGQKYWSHCGFSGRVEWCSCFVKTGWDACGLDSSLGSPPGAAMANSWISWVKNDPSKGKLIKNDSHYSPKPGDIVVSGEPNGVSNHVGIAVEEADGNGRYRCIEGNSGDHISSTHYFPGQYWDWVFRPNYPDAGGSGALMEGVDFSIGEKRFVDEWAKRIDDYFKNKSGHPHAPLNGHGRAFAQAAWDAHFDPRFLPAVSLIESGCGEQVPSYSKYNCYGWGITSSGPVPAAYSDGYDTFIYKIVVEGKLGSKMLKDYTSVGEIAPVWCPPNAEHWERTVSGEMAKM